MLNSGDAASLNGISERPSSPSTPASNPEEAEDQSNYFTYPPVGGVPSGDISAREFNFLRSGDEVNDMIVDGEFGRLQFDRKNEKVCFLDTSVWQDLAADDGQNPDLTKISLPDELFGSYDFIVIPIRTTIANRVYWMLP
jgi:hypothetical protein